jgi:hypothetical protein
MHASLVQGADDRKLRLVVAFFVMEFPDKDQPHSFQVVEDLGQARLGTIREPKDPVPESKTRRMDKTQHKETEQAQGGQETPHG